jgi:hypothetical protein
MPAGKKNNSKHTEAEEAEAGLRALFHSKYAPRIPFEESDRPPEVFITDEDAARMFVESLSKLFKKRYIEPLRHLKGQRPFEQQPYGRLLETQRLDLRLEHVVLDEKLGQPMGFIRQLENGEIVPWHLSPAVGAEIADLYRHHIDLLPNLLRWSTAAYREREAAMQSGLSHPPIDEASPGALRMFDLAAARTNPNEKLPAEAEDWVAGVRSELEKRQAYDLLNRSSLATTTRDF